MDLRNRNDLSQINQKKYIHYLSEFEYSNVPLPDHKTGRLAETSEIKRAVDKLELLISKGPVFMHCHAAAERSPLISIAYLYKNKGLSLIQACDYVKQQNKSTNLHLQQIRVIDS